MIAALIAVMAIPGAYVPLSFHQPLKQRVEFLRKNGIDIILVRESVLEVGHSIHCKIHALKKLVNLYKSQMSVGSGQNMTVR